MLQLHGPFILASAQGLELFTLERDFSQTREQSESFRSAAIAFAEELQLRPAAVDPLAAVFVAEASRAAGQGEHPERSGVSSVATILNAAITISGGAAIAALAISASSTKDPAGMAAALIATEGMKKSVPFAATASLFTKGFDLTSAALQPASMIAVGRKLKNHLEIVLSSASHLQSIADNQKEFEWLRAFIDWARQYKN